MSEKYLADALVMLTSTTSNGNALLMEREAVALIEHIRALTAERDAEHERRKAAEAAAGQADDAMQIVSDTHHNWKHRTLTFREAMGEIGGAIALWEGVPSTVATQPQPARTPIPPVAPQPNDTRAAVARSDSLAALAIHIESIGDVIERDLAGRTVSDTDNGFARTVDALTVIHNILAKLIKSGGAS